MTYAGTIALAIAVHHLPDIYARQMFGYYVGRDLLAPLAFHR